MSPFCGLRDENILRGHEFRKFSRRPHGQHSYAFSFFPTCVGVEKTSFKNFVLFLCPLIRLRVINFTIYIPLISEIFQIKTMIIGLVVSRSKK